MVKRYSSFITFPIELLAEKTDYVEVGTRARPGTRAIGRRLGY